MTDETMTTPKRDWTGEFAYLDRIVSSNNDEFLRHYIESIKLTAQRMAKSIESSAYERGRAEVDEVLAEIEKWNGKCVVGEDERTQGYWEGHEACRSTVITLIQSKRKV